MRPTRILAHPILLLALASLLAALSSTQAFAQSLSVVQPILVAPANAPYNGLANLRVQFFTAPRGGQQVGTTQDFLNVRVTNGLAPLMLSVPSDRAADAQWIQLRASFTPGGPMTFLGRQPVYRALRSINTRIAAGTGPTGPEGPVGSQGPVGSIGPSGPQGLAGPAGPQGSQGSVGQTGLTGTRGNTGPIGAAGPQGPAGTLGPAGTTGLRGRSLNPLRLATNRWFVANRAFGSDIDVASSGTGPRAIVYAADTIWILLGNTNNIARLDPRTGDVRGATSTGITSPSFLCAAIDRVWVAGSATIASVNSAGTASSTIVLDSPVSGMVFDGNYLYAMTNAGIRRLNPLTGASTGLTSNTLTALAAPIFDGTSIWAISGNNLLRIDPATLTQTASIPVGPQPSFLVYDGRLVWCINASSTAATASRITAASAMLLDTVPIQAGSLSAVFDGDRVWTLSLQNSRAIAYRLDTGAPVSVNGNVVQVTTTAFPIAGAFDGINVWVAGALGTTITRY